jgi:hypothetical protein
VLDLGDTIGLYSVLNALIQHQKNTQIKTELEQKLSAACMEALKQGTNETRYKADHVSTLLSWMIK